VVLPWLRDSRHKDILARHGRAWVWQGGIMFAAMAATNALFWCDCAVPTVYLALWVGAILAWLVATWYFVVRNRHGLSPVEKQLAQLVTISVLTSGLFILCTSLTGTAPMRVLPLWLLLMSVAAGSGAVVLGGTFYLLACLCALSAVVTAVVPTVGPITFGAAYAVGMVAAAWNHIRSDPDE
jgi:hypothetical protein